MSSGNKSKVVDVKIEEIGNSIELYSQPTKSKGIRRWNWTIILSIANDETIKPMGTFEY